MEHETWKVITNKKYITVLIKKQSKIQHNSIKSTAFLDIFCLLLIKWGISLNCSIDDYIT